MSQDQVQWFIHCLHSYETFIGHLLPYVISISIFVFKPYVKILACTISPHACLSAGWRVKGSFRNNTDLRAESTQHTTCLTATPDEVSCLFLLPVKHHEMFLSAYVHCTIIFVHILLLIFFLQAQFEACFALIAIINHKKKNVNATYVMLHRSSMRYIVARYRSISYKYK